MITTFLIFNSILWVSWWLLACAFCFALYRAIRLQSLPWIGLYYAVGIVAVPLMQYYGHRISISLHLPDMKPSDFPPRMMLGTFIATTLDYGGDLLVLILALSEGAVLVGRVYPEARSRLLQALVALHRHTRMIGIVAILLTALLPVPAMIYFYAYR
ncbi:MAG: hypothetical protein ABI217_12395 [Chthoniobacterales bacterium]